MEVEYNFVIYIEPCLVTSYYAVTTFGMISYNIGAVDKTGGFYLFG
jgi:hypothetical protein